MKIAINCAFYQPKGGGIKEYIDNLVKNIALADTSHEIILYVLEDQLDFAKKNLPDKFRIKIIPFLSGSKFNRIKRSLLESEFWRKEEKTEKFDIFHSPFFHAPNLKNAKTLLTVHDLRLYRFPDTYEFFRYQFLKRKVRSSIRRADHIISISEFTKKEIKDLVGVNEDKITVIHEAIDPERFSDTGGGNDIEVPQEVKNNPFILSVGHMEPRKNYDKLIEAFSLLRKDANFENLQLVIVGKKDHSFKQTLKKIEETPGVHYLNFVAHGTLLWLYRNTSLFVFPSYYEGFGFPPLEAGALNAVSAVSNVSSMPEVCKDGVFYFNPQDVNEMARVIKEALSDSAKREDVLKKMKNRIKELSWYRNAEDTLKVYESLK